LRVVQLGEEGWSTARTSATASSSIFNDHDRRSIDRLLVVPAARGSASPDEAVAQQRSYVVKDVAGSRSVPGQLRLVRLRSTAAG